MAKASFLLTEDEDENELACGPLETSAEDIEDINDVADAVFVDGEPAGEIHPESVLLDPGDIELDTVTDIRSSIESTESIREFAAQIDANGGWTTPVLVRPPAEAGGKHRVIAGRRRIAAAKVNGDQVVAYVIHCDDATARRLAFEENHRRKGFTVVDYAKLFLEARGEKYLPNWSERVSKQFGVSRATVTEAIKTYEAIQHDPALVAKIASGEMKADAAIELSKVKEEERATKLSEAQLLANAEAAAKRARAAGKPKVESEGIQVTEWDRNATYEAADGKDKAVQPAKVRAKHVRAAVEQDKGTAAVPKATVPSMPLGISIPNALVYETLRDLIDESYPAPMNAFLTAAADLYLTPSKALVELAAQHWRAIANLIEEKDTAVPPGMVLVPAVIVGSSLVKTPTAREMEHKRSKQTTAQVELGNSIKRAVIVSAKNAAAKKYAKPAKPAKPTAKKSAKSHRK